MLREIKILGIIPARGGSKRVPGKNKKLLAGKPLIEYAIESSLQSKYIDTLIVSSDDEEILAIAKRYPKLIALLRPEEISGDEAQAITYVHHALASLNYVFDIIVIIQPSSPLTLASDIDATISLLFDNPNADSAVSVMRLDHAIHPIKLKVLDGGSTLKPYLEEENGRMAAHELPELFVRNCSVYVSKIKTIKEGKIIGDLCLGYVMPRERSIDINDPMDFEFAEFLIKRNGK
jgi:CMP-N,N'-diacetyllegionaminic acid synthase